jgi:formate hydrogenlyase subunit 3/multisubunit Na+/H+ antiporter MnhD subunit
MTPLVPLAILLLGAGALLFTLSPRFPYAGLTAIVTAALALAALLGMAFGLPSVVTLSEWGPASLLPMKLMLAADALAWAVVVSIAALTLATLLTSVARPGGPRLLVRGAMLLLAFAGIAAVFADNLITRIMAWAGLDLIYFMALTLLSRGDRLHGQAVLNLSFNAVATLLATGAAVLLMRASPTASLREAAVSPTTTLLITLAAVFRLGLFPLHLGLPTEGNIRQGLGTLLRLIPAAVALELLTRLALYGIAEPLRPWLTVFGVMTALAGSAQFWETSDVSQSLTYIIITQSGLALLTALWGGPQAATALTAQTLALMLGGGLLYLAHGYDAQRRSLTLLSGMGVAILLGAPLTIGFAGVNALYTGLINAGGWLWLALIGVIVAQANTVVRLMRALLWPSDAAEGDTLALTAYASGLALLALLAVVGGVGVNTLAVALGQPMSGALGFTGPLSLAALALIVLTATAGILMWRFDISLSARAEGAATFLASLTRMGWLYSGLGSVIRVLSALISTLAQVLEGEGALLWAIVAALAIGLLFR